MILYILSRRHNTPSTSGPSISPLPHRSHQQQTQPTSPWQIVEVLKKLRAIRTTVFSPHNHAQEFFACLTYVLIQLEQNCPIQLDTSATAKWHVAIDPPSASRNPISQEISQTACKVWEDVFVSKKPIIEELFKVTFPSPDPPALSTVRDQVYDSALKFWMTYLANELSAKKSSVSSHQSWEIHTQLQSKIQKVTGGLTRLARSSIRKELSVDKDLCSGAGSVSGSERGGGPGDGGERGGGRFSRRNLIDAWGTLLSPVLKQRYPGQEIGKDSFFLNFLPARNACQCQFSKLERDLIFILMVGEARRLEAVAWRIVAIVKENRRVQERMRENDLVHLKRFVCDSLLPRLEREVTRERGVWGADHSSNLGQYTHQYFITLILSCPTVPGFHGHLKCKKFFTIYALIVGADKWMLDTTEGPCRMRKKLIRNDQFYEHYPFVPLAPPTSTSSSRPPSTSSPIAASPCKSPLPPFLKSHSTKNQAPVSRDSYEYYRTHPLTQLFEYDPDDPVDEQQQQQHSSSSCAPHHRSPLNSTSSVQSSSNNLGLVAAGSAAVAGAGGEPEDDAAVVAAAAAAATTTDPEETHSTVLFRLIETPHEKIVRILLKSCEQFRHLKFPTNKSTLPGSWRPSRLIHFVSYSL